MSNPFSDWSNPLRTLQQLLPTSRQSHDQALEERVGALEQHIARLEQQSRWQDHELDRRLTTLDAQVQYQAKQEPHPWKTTDRVLFIIVCSLAAAMLIPMFLILFGVIQLANHVMAWVVFGLAAFAVVLCAFTLFFHRQLPRTQQATLLFVTAVMLLACTLLV